MDDGKVKEGLRSRGWDDLSGASLDELGEELVLARLIALAGKEGAIPAGDDAAGWSQDGGVGLISTDTMVEGVHFRRTFQSPYLLGEKAWAQAASDLAAMGAWPQLAVVAGVFPGSTPVEAVEAVQLGLVEAAGAVGARIVGGDLSSGPVVTVTVTVVGGTRDGNPVRLGAARSGDRILVTGRLGAAAAALISLQAGGEPAPPAWMERLIRPSARLAEGELLRRRGCTALTDLSDGLVLDARRMAGASGLRIELWAQRLPLADPVPGPLPGSALGLALTGGEDYELLAAIPPSEVDGLLAAWPSQLAPLSEVGVAGPGHGVLVLDHPGGSELAVGGEVGYQHFR